MPAVGPPVFVNWHYCGRVTAKPFTKSLTANFESWLLHETYMEGVVVSPAGQEARD